MFLSYVGNIMHSAEMHRIYNDKDIFKKVLNFVYCVYSDKMICSYFMLEYIYVYDSVFIDACMYIFMSCNITVMVLSTIFYKAEAYNG